MIDRVKVILQCPVSAAGVPALSRKRPLVLSPFLGETVLAHTLAGLSGEGAKHICLQAGERTAEVLRAVGGGEIWGLKITGPDEREFAGARRFVLDSLPQAPGLPLWTSYSHWFDAQMALLERMARQRVGMRELSPGVYVGLRTRLAPDARLTGPLWIGDNVFIGPGAVVGPRAVVEDDSYLDDGSEVVESIVGPATYAGSFTELRRSFAWGRELLQLDTGSLTEVQDRFLLSDATPPKFSLTRLWKQWRQRFSTP